MMGYKEKLLCDYKIWILWIYYHGWFAGIKINFHTIENHFYNHQKFYNCRQVLILSSCFIFDRHIYQTSDIKGVQTANSILTDTCSIITTSLDQLLYSFKLHSVNINNKSEDLSWFLILLNALNYGLYRWFKKTRTAIDWLYSVSLEW